MVVSGTLAGETWEESKKERPFLTPEEMFFARLRAGWPFVSTDFSKTSVNYSQNVPILETGPHGFKTAFHMYNVFSTLVPAMR